MMEIRIHEYIGVEFSVEFSAIEWNLYLKSELANSGNRGLTWTVYFFHVREASIRPSLVYVFGES